MVYGICETVMTPGAEPDSFGFLVIAPSVGGICPARETLRSTWIAVLVLICLTG